MEVTGLLDSICHISLLSPSELLLCKSQLGQSTVFVEPKFTIKSTLTTYTEINSCIYFTALNAIYTF